MAASAMRQDATAYQSKSNIHPCEVRRTGCYKTTLLLRGPGFGTKIRQAYEGKKVTLIQPE
jgi:hypothetical protein